MLQHSANKEMVSFTGMIDQNQPKQLSSWKCDPFQQIISAFKKRSCLFGFSELCYTVLHRQLMCFLESKEHIFIEHTA